jgi:tetratricopeptide (TPR) repeat protein
MPVEQARRTVDPMNRQDERPEERRRQHNPAWATVPTMAWRRVATEEGIDEEEIQRVERRRPAQDEQPTPPPTDRDHADRGQARVPTPAERRDRDRSDGDDEGDSGPGFIPGRGDRALLERGAIEDEADWRGDPDDDWRGGRDPDDDWRGGRDQRPRERIERGPDERGPGERGPGGRGPGDRVQGLAGPGDRGRGDRVQGSAGPADRGRGEHGPGERGSGEPGHDDRGPSGRGLGEHGHDRRPGDLGPGQRGHDDRRPGERGHDDRRPGERGHDDRRLGQRGHDDRRPGERGPDERGSGERGKGDRGYGDPGDRGRGRGDGFPADGQRPARQSYGQVLANPQRGPRRGPIRLTPPLVQPSLYAGSGHRVVSPDALTAPTPAGGLPYSGTAAVPADGLAEEDAVAVVATEVSADEADDAIEDAGPDPEQVLATWDWTFDPDTLREIPDDPERLREVRESLTAKLNSFSDNPRRARLLSLRAVVSRILGDLPKALADGKLALAHAEATGELRRIAIAQARLAHVLQWQEEFEEADRLFTLANSSELPDRLRATMHQHAGKCAYDQGRYMEACNHFERALELRKEEDPQLIAQTEMALDAVFTKVAKNGWGPYPRSRDEILQLGKTPTPALDESTGLWGFIDAAGETVVAAEYDDVQPFRDGVAWVQRPDAQTWELIDEAGQTLIPAGSGYVGVSSFSDGLAWVSRDGNARWIGIDKNNNVTISTGFDDVRPFRRGMAAVRRGRRWGAVDGVGRVIVPFAYDGFATALSDGRYIDGFSDEGLAVVELGGRKGVVDRAGRVLVEPVHPALVIHPVAFLVTDGTHRWGALDRHGRRLIEPTHPSRMGVSDEIDRLLSDARPVL